MNSSPKNPKWSRDELILALDLYFQDPPVNSSKDPRAVALSEILNKLPQPDGVVDQGRFRNANGVNMKLANFRRLDPRFVSSGKVGLQRGGKLEESIWTEFSNDRTALAHAAKRIKESLQHTSKQTWIFQGNAKMFDIDRYLAEHAEQGTEVRWVINQPRNGVKSGDTVYFWRTMRDAADREFGVVASAQCVSGIEVLPDDAAELWKKPPASELMERVRMIITDYRPSSLDGMLTADFLRQHHSTESLRILKMKNETNYLLTDAEARSLRQFWSDQSADMEPALQEEFPEGRLVMWRHLRRERNKKLVAEVRKASLQAHGYMFCEACKMRFDSVYGSDAPDCLEVHHGVPLHTLQPGQPSKLSDMHLLCPNCHRVIHRSDPWLTVDQLRSRLTNVSTNTK